MNNNKSQSILSLMSKNHFVNLLYYAYCTPEGNKLFSTDIMDFLKMAIRCSQITMCQATDKGYSMDLNLFSLL